MKVKLLRKLRKDIRISDFKYGFYDLEMYYGFKWRRQGSFHFLSDLLKEVHFTMNYRLKNNFIVKLMISASKKKNKTPTNKND